MIEEETVARMKEIRELLDEFGLVLHGYDPGVSAYFKDHPERGHGYWGEPISFDRLNGSGLNRCSKSCVKHASALTQ